MIKFFEIFAKVMLCIACFNLGAVITIAYYETKYKEIFDKYRPKEKIKCIKTVNLNFVKDPIHFMEGKTYEISERSRTTIAAWNEKGESHMIAQRWYGWKHDKWYKEHFKFIK